jgi:hypothetical protein
MKVQTGIQCVIGWYDSPDSMDDVFISFSEELLNHEGNPAEEDVYGVSDEKIFYYLSKEEVASLMKAISEVRDRWSCGNEWFIDLVEDYEIAEYEVEKL